MREINENNKEKKRILVIKCLYLILDNPREVRSKNSATSNQSNCGK